MEKMMKRRQFLNGLTAATISGMAIAGCNTNNPQNNASLVTPIPTPTPVAHDCTGGKPDEICYKAQMLMILMLAFSQVDQKTGEHFVDKIFPDKNDFTDFQGHKFTKEFGIDAKALEFFRNSLVGKPGGARGPRTPKQVRDTFQAMHTFSSLVITYTGSECPSTTSLKTIIATAKAQNQ
jgi:hypothetical protein